MVTKTALASLVKFAPTRRAVLATGADSYRYGYRGYNLVAVLSEMISAHVVKGMHAYYVDGDAAQFKQDFYLASYLNLRRYKLHGLQSIDTWMPLLYSLLSDCDSLIADFATLETPEHCKYRDQPRTFNFMVHMYQLAVQGDDDALRRKILIGAERCGQPYRREFSSSTDFFSLLLTRDKAALETKIKRLANRRGQDHPVFEGLMRTDSALKAKICWLRGIEVHVDSPMLPMELMPHQPLSHYDNVYDFLEPGWVPPPQGLIGKASRWFASLGKS